MRAINDQKTDNMAVSNDGWIPRKKRVVENRLNSGEVAERSKALAWKASVR